MQARRSAPPALVIVDDEAWPPAPPNLTVVPLHAYLLAGGDHPGSPVINLSRARETLSAGYYASLLADARGVPVQPDVDTLRGLADPYAVFRALAAGGVATLDAAEQEARGGGDLPMVQRGTGARWRPAREDELRELLILGGTTEDGRFRAIARRIHQAWPHPMLRAGLVRDQRRWRVYRLDALDAAALTPAQREALLRRIARASAPEPDEEPGSFALAVLFDTSDPYRPSAVDTITRLERVGARMGVSVHRVGPDDLGRLGEFDALFIRSLAGVDQPAWRFAQRAESIGMPVIDDTAAMLRCGNKVHLHALLDRAGLATPRTALVGADTRFEAIAEALGLPFVLKLPDSSFSRGVRRVDDAEGFAALAGPWLEHSPLLVAQAWLPTAFDWRVGVLDGRPLFTCRYHMAKGHWQIARVEGGRTRYGRTEAVPRDLAPPDVVALACEAASLLGEGFYGVDLKETDDGPVVIEINDNANLEDGIEDAADGDRIYEDLLGWFAHRLQPDRPLPSRPRAEPLITALRAPIEAPVAPQPYTAWSVVGLELEYPIVDARLDAAGLVADTLRALRGRPCSEVELGAVAASNEIVDHVLELKTPLPLESLVESERALAQGVRRVAMALSGQGARLLPTGMHPWFDPRRARLWTRSGRRIYATYARLFDVRTHGWANVQACHVNLPMGEEHEAVAMMNAAAMLVPYLPAMAASSPVHDGRLQPHVDGRLAYILTHQSRVPESMGELVPEPIVSLADYRARVLNPMYAAVDRLPDAGLLRREYFNARAAVFKASRASMEVRVLDVQECVKADAAIAAFTRAALRWIVEQELRPPEHATLVRDLRACVAEGTRARVEAPHLLPGGGTARAALARLLEGAAGRMRPDEQVYLPLLEGIVARGSLGERLAEHLRPRASDPMRLRQELARTWRELSDCLVENRPWEGR